MNLGLLNLTMQAVFVKLKQLIGVVPPKSANQHRNAFVIMKRTIKNRTIMFLFTVVLFSLSTRSGAML